MSSKKLTVSSWDSTYAAGSNSAYFDNGILPFNIRPVITVPYNLDFLNYVNNNMKDGYFPLLVEGSGLYDGAFALCSMYTNDLPQSHYFVVLATKWAGYPLSNGSISWGLPSPMRKKISAPSAETSRYTSDVYVSNYRKLLILIILCLVLAMVIRIYRKKYEK